MSAPSTSFASLVPNTGIQPCSDKRSRPVGELGSLIQEANINTVLVDYGWPPQEFHVEAPSAFESIISSRSDYIFAYTYPLA
ncbi:hypothetical protein HAX54_007144 [Datura stramonium]|uniref:Uncharacterized protein n=1 Tax=Datura stramonium TaxID=4076 RepID=A0ABS8TBB0_DATST|nr:hypothetical protein [Datura stramonium]